MFKSALTQELEDVFMSVVLRYGDRDNEFEQHVITTLVELVQESENRDAEIIKMVSEYTKEA